MSQGRSRRDTFSWLVRVEQHAERFGIPGVWAWEDVEAARQEGKVFGRSPFDVHRNQDQLWQGREPLRAEEWGHFRRR